MTRPRNIASQRETFLASLDVGSSFYRIFDDIPGVSFFAKSREGVLLFASRGILERYGYTSESEIVGKTDFDLNPSSFAQNYVRDDAQVYQTGEAIRNRLEPWFNQRGLPEWHLTTKHPLRNRSGAIIGVMGVIRPVDAAQPLPGSTREILPAVELLSGSFRNPLSVAALAKHCGCSIRTLQYRFRSCFNMTAQEFVMRLRIDYACQLMNDPGRDLGDIAVASGFADQSAFTRKFRELMKLTPLHYRKRIWQEESPGDHEAPAS